MKVIVAFLYLEALLRLGEAVTITTGLSDDSRDIMTNARVVFLGLTLALIPFLLGKHLARGVGGLWLLTLAVLAVLDFGFALESVLGDVSALSILHVVLPLAVLAALARLFAPIVRRHCAQR